MTQKISDVIERILLTSRHAPSSHNSQPWQVSVTGQTVTLGYAKTRQLTVGDPQKRELFISLGCFIESFIITASGLGYSVITHFINEEPQRITSLTLHKHKTTTQNHILESLILKRRSDRRFYQPKHLEPGLVDQLQQLSIDNTHIQLFTDAADIEFLAQQTHKATIETMSNPAFRAELASWVRNNWTRQPDGMPAYTQGIPGPISLLAKFIIKKNKAVARDQAKKDSQRVLHSAAIGLICSEQQSPASWLNAGQLYQRACLLALQQGVKTSGVSASIIYPLTTKQITAKLRLQGQPVALIRFGYTKNNPKASPRLPLHQFLITNS